MKFREYRLSFTGDPKVIGFLDIWVPDTYSKLARANAVGRAANLLFGVEFEVESVVRPRKL